MAAEQGRWTWPGRIWKPELMGSIEDISAELTPAVRVAPLGEWAWGGWGDPRKEEARAGSRSRLRNIGTQRAPTSWVRDNRGGAGTELWIWGPWDRLGRLRPQRDRRGRERSRKEAPAAGVRHRDTGTQPGRSSASSGELSWSATRASPKPHLLVPDCGSDPTNSAGSACGPAGASSSAPIPRTPALRPFHS